MNIKKQIEVTVTACDICHKPTSRSNWSGWYEYRFCKTHKWIEELLNICKTNSKQFSNGTGYLSEIISFMKEAIKKED